MSHLDTTSTPLSPGAYLRLRRRAERLSQLQLAARIYCYPHLSEHGRAAWIELIERDVMPATWSTIAAISVHVSIDLDLLQALDAVRLGGATELPQHCRGCGVTPRQVIPTHIEWQQVDRCPVCIAFPANAVDQAA